jgi:hypothetical protein
LWRNNVSLPVPDSPTISGIVREYFPTATDEQIEHILWGKTGFPGFWQMPRDGQSPEACLRSQLAREAERVGRGLTVCFLCGSDMPLAGDERDCPACGGDLDRAGSVLQARTTPPP